MGGVVLDIKVQGKEGNIFNEDSRVSHLTAALWFPNQEVLRDELGLGVSQQLFNGEELLTQNSGMLLLNLLKRLLPKGYYNEVVEGK